MLDAVVAGGQVVTERTVAQANVAIKDGRVVGLVDPSVTLEAARTIDAAGKIVMPGVVDAHFHCATLHSRTHPFDDTFEVASTTAAYGGVTTLMAFVWGEPGEPLAQFLNSFIGEVGSRFLVDFSFHCGLRPEMPLIRQVGDAFELGVTSFKMHTDYRKTGGGRMSDDDHRLAAMEQIGQRGGILMVHAENGYIIDYLEDKYIAQGKVAAGYLLPSRPNLAEAVAVHSCIVLGEIAQCPLYIVHLSAKEALEEIAAAQAQGKAVYTETCPQYLLLTNDHMLKDGGLSKVGPPLRTEVDTKAMWWGIQNGTIETVASDHAAVKVARKREAGNDIFQVPFGSPQIETMLPLLYSVGVAQGRISLTRMVELLCEHPARRFGLYPKKGTLQVGADADLVVFDPNIEWAVRAADLHTAADHTPYEGWKVRGRPVVSLLRGQVLLEGGKLYQKPGFGQFIARRPA